MVDVAIAIVDAATATIVFVVVATGAIASVAADVVGTRGTCVATATPILIDDE